MRQELLDKVNVLLLKKGFTLKNLARACFDVLARKEGQILLIKVLEDANSISRQHTQEMITVASYAHSSPIIIAEKAGTKLDDNVVYSRFDVHTLNYQTFLNCISNKFPFVRRGKAGLTASLAGKKFREKREELGYSLNALSKKIGVTSRSITKYENENSEVTINNAMKIYDLFGYHVFNKINIFRNCSQQSKPDADMGKNGEASRPPYYGTVSRKYIELGFDAAETKKTPFDIIAKKGDGIILTEVSDNVNPQMQPLSKLLEADNLVIFKKKKPKNIPSMTKEDFMDFEKANELMKFLKEF